MPASTASPPPLRSRRSASGSTTARRRSSARRARLDRHGATPPNRQPRSTTRLPPAPAPAPAAGDMSAVFQDPSFLQSVLGSLPGVDPNDPRIQSVLQKQDGDKKEDEDKK
mmetsp:Transcript_7596/g.23969  ORF Transcript_7596/g.23969 Transcript_7596/m.23969 type:complete len:111 (-) Transcript_7596:303-635(-)